jgi:RNA polymerase sigma factor (sigma-70 family)
MHNPFSEEPYPDTTEQVLAEFAQQGDKEALVKLIKAHQAWIFNIALRMVYDREEAADVTQEALIKMITKLSTFKGESKFRTWLYRIVANHVINMKKRQAEKMVTSFEEYGAALDGIEDADLPDSKSGQVDANLLVEEAKVSCMTGMLLCLNREQRLIFILGEIFKVSDTVGGELLEISRDNFRQRLSRARKDLYNFMNEKCGLLNRGNPCRCARKTKGFIELGIVDPQSLTFSQGHHHSIKLQARWKSQYFDEEFEPKYGDLYREHPFQTSPDFVHLLNRMVSGSDFKQLFDFG